MKAFLTGFGIGLGIAILFAPESGETTRRKLRHTMNDSTTRLTRQANRAKRAISGQMKGFSNASYRREREVEKKGTARVDSSQVDSINSVSREQLMTVNGIGPVLAERIISGRPYSSTQDLVDRGIIAQSTLEELRKQFGSGQRRSA